MQASQVSNAPRSSESLWPWSGVSRLVAPPVSAPSTAPHVWLLPPTVPAEARFHLEGLLHRHGLHGLRQRSAISTAAVGHDLQLLLLDQIRDRDHPDRPPRAHGLPIGDALRSQECVRPVAAPRTPMFGREVLRPRHDSEPPSRPATCSVASGIIMNDPPTAPALSQTLPSTGTTTPPLEPVVHISYRTLCDELNFDVGSLSSLPRHDHRSAAHEHMCASTLCRGSPRHVQVGQEEHILHPAQADEWPHGGRHPHSQTPASSSTSSPESSSPFCDAKRQCDFVDSAGPCRPRRHCRPCPLVALAATTTRDANSQRTAETPPAMPPPATPPPRRQHQQHHHQQQDLPQPHQQQQGRHLLPHEQTSPQPPQPSYPQHLQSQPPLRLHSQSAQQQLRVQPNALRHLRLNFGWLVEPQHFVNTFLSRGRLLSAVLLLFRSAREGMTRKKQVARPCRPVCLPGCLPCSGFDRRCVSSGGNGTYVKDCQPTHSVVFPPSAPPGAVAASQLLTQGSRVV